MLFNRIRKHYSHNTEHNTTYVVQKAVTLQVFSACVCSDMEVMESCSVAATSMGFSAPGTKIPMEVFCPSDISRGRNG